LKAALECDVRTWSQRQDVFIPLPETQVVWGFKRAVHNHGTMWGWSFRELPPDHQQSQVSPDAASGGALGLAGVGVDRESGKLIGTNENAGEGAVGGAARAVGHANPSGNHDRLDASSPRTYHINTVSFVRPELEAAGWRPARRGDVAGFAMWTSQRAYSLTDHARGASAKAQAERKMRRALRELYSRANLDAIDDKALLAGYFRAHGLDDGDGVPTTYLSVQELVDASGLSDDNDDDAMSPHTDTTIHPTINEASDVGCAHEAAHAAHVHVNTDDGHDTSSKNSVVGHSGACSNDDSGATHGDSRCADTARGAAVLHRDRKRLFFLKLAAVDAALGVWCFATRREVVDAVAERGLKEGTFVVQREVARPRLRDGRKCSVRSYVVVWNRTLWLWREFLLKVHASPYASAAATDDAAHIHCRGAGPGVTALRGSVLPTYADDLAEMARLVGLKLGPWAASLDAPSQWSNGHYAIIGMDFIFNTDGRGNIIEANCSPCMFDTSPGTNAIKRDLARAFCSVFVAPSADGLPHRAAESGEFVSCACGGR
jgi:hypothetical protein